MVLLYSALFVCVCISLLLHSHVAQYYATTAYASHENSKRTDYITEVAIIREDFLNEVALGRMIGPLTTPQAQSLLHSNFL